MLFVVEPFLPYISSLLEFTPEQLDKTEIISENDYTYIVGETLDLE